MRKCAARSLCYVLCLAAGFASADPSHPEIRLCTLAVGYGEAHLLTISQGENSWAALIDAGPAEAADRLLEGLQKRDIHRLQWVFLSHPHPNHYAGLAGILGKVPIEKVVWGGTSAPEDLSELLGRFRKAGTDVINASAFEEAVEEQGLRIGIVHPELATGDIHADCLVLLATYQETGLLFGGDVAELSQSAALARARTSLSQSGASLRLITWPHHGDRLDPAWQAAMREAEVVIVSAGPNPYGLPLPSFDPGVWKNALRTDQEGDLCFRLRSRGIDRLR